MTSTAQAVERGSSGAGARPVAAVNPDDKALIDRHPFARLHYTTIAPHWTLGGTINVSETTTAAHGGWWDLLKLKRGNNFGGSFSSEIGPTDINFPNSPTTDFNVTSKN